MSFTFLFYKHIMLRKSCSNCHYTNTRRPSDITIGDFWGVEKINPPFGNDNKGLSLMMINTPKGKEVFEVVKKDVNFFESKVADCLQPNLVQPTRKHPCRDKFERDYAAKGFAYIYRKYGEDGWRSKRDKAIRKIKDILRPFVRPLIKLWK